MTALSMLSYFLISLNFAQAAEVNYYQVLDVVPSASELEIKRAYQKKAMALHPDRNPGHENEFKCAKEAYEVLSGKLAKPSFESSSCKEFFAIVKAPSRAQETRPFTASPAPMPHKQNDLSLDQLIMLSLQMHLGESKQILTQSAYNILKEHLDPLLIHQTGSPHEVEHVAEIIIHLMTKTGLSAQMNLGRLELYEAISKAGFMYFKKLHSVNAYTFHNTYEKAQRYYKANLAYMLQNEPTELMRTYRSILDFSVIYKRSCDQILTGA
jgi:hypothetical protein